MEQLTVNNGATTYAIPQKQGVESTNSTDKKYLYAKLAEIILFRAPAAVADLAYRSIKVLIYVPLKAAVLVIRRRAGEAGDFIGEEAIKTLKAVRSVVVIPLKIGRVINDIRAPIIQFKDSGRKLKPKDYLSTDYDVSFQYFSSEHFPNKNLKVIVPKGVEEMPAYTDPNLKAVMASDFLKPGIIGIGFGSPNVFLFNSSEDGLEVVNAKSFKREDMKYEDSKGKLQSGVFLIPTNLPENALKAFEEAAKTMAGRRDHTCVNTCCRVLKEAGFTMDGVPLEKCYLPTTLLENMLFRNLYYKGEKVHLDIINTTGLRLEEYFDKIDTAVLTTPVRHLRRSRDTEAAKKKRGEEAARIMKNQKERLKTAPLDVKADEFKNREIKISVPSFWGNLAARFWGRHTVYEIDLSDKEKEIGNLFKNKSLKPFPQKNPDFITRLKRDLFFSKRGIHFLRGHMIGRQDSVKMSSKDFLRMLRFSNGVRLNYALLNNKIIIGRVSVARKNEAHRKAADWALSKHALLANREEVCCAGEVWYDEKTDRFLLNNESGTYHPDRDSLEKTVGLAKEIFGCNAFAAAEQEKREEK